MQSARPQPPTAHRDAASRDTGRRNSCAWVLTLLALALVATSSGRMAAASSVPEEEVVTPIVGVVNLQPHYSPKPRSERSA
jgi:hypothetical protein